MIASHFWEIALFLKDTYEELPEIRDFVAALPAEAQREFECVIATASDSPVPSHQIYSLSKELGGHRSVFFHYAELDEKKALKGREQLQRAMEAAAEQTSHITIGGNIASVRFDFADEISVKFLGTTEEEHVHLMERLRDPVAAVIRLAERATNAYLGSLPAGTVKLEDPPKTEG